MKKHVARFVLGLCVVLMLGHAGQVWQIPFVTALEAYLYDARLRLTMPERLISASSIVDIDEELGEVGCWPWGRNVMAELVRRRASSIRRPWLVLMSFLLNRMPVPACKCWRRLAVSSSRTIPSISEPCDLRPQLDYDQLFADTLRGYRWFWAFISPVKIRNKREFCRRRRWGHRPLPADLFPLFPGTVSAAICQNFSRWQPGGHFNPLVEPGWCLPSRANAGRVSWRVLRGALAGRSCASCWGPMSCGRARSKMTKVSNGLIYLTQGSVRIPVDEHVAALIPYRGYERSFVYISAVDVLKGRASAEQLAGRIVLVGTTAPGLMDLRATPVGGAYPGVEVHANLIAGMLDNNIKRQPGYLPAAEVFQLILIGGLLVVFLPWLSPIRAMLLAMTSLASVLAFNLWLWHSFNLVMPVAATIFLLIVLYGLNMTWQLFCRVAQQASVCRVIWTRPAAGTGR